MSNEEKEVQRMYFERVVDETFIDPSVEVKYPPVAISMGSYRYTTKEGDKEFPVPIGTYGNFSFVQAPPKSMKTFFVSLLSAVYLNGQVEGFSGEMKGYRKGRALVHFDTEQGEFHASKVFRRPLEMVGETQDNYHTLALRQFSPKDRLEFIEWYLENKVDDVGLVIVDGIADLCNDVNNIEESNKVVQKVMEWTAKHKCHMVLVIHSNFGSDKPTGHLGSFLEKKTETQIQLEKNTKHNNMVTVSCKRSRNYSFDKFSFEVDKYGLPSIVGDLYDPLDGF